jgi:signal peptidase I
MGRMKRKKRIPIIAAILSFITPGLGQLYNGQIVKGICFFLVLLLIPIILLLAGLHFQFYGLVVILLFSICLWLFIIGEAYFSAKRKKEVVLKRYNKWYVYLLIILLMLGTNIIPADFMANIASETLRFNAYKMPTGSMEPTLSIGDYLIADFKYFKKNELQRGDLVILQYPKDPTKVFIKRVIALEGEKIEIKDKQVYVNDEAIPESYKVHKGANLYDAIRDNFGPELVPSDHCFVLGDNRDNSMDSRYWGFLPIKNIKGKPLYIYWAKDKKRIGKKIE